jgi:branched-chain amino acid transport system permease protein
MEFIIQQIVTGLSVGGTYALIAIGFVMIFGVLNVLNIAHSQSIMIAPVALTLLVEAGVSVPLAILAAFLITFATMLAVHAIAVRPFIKLFTKADPLTPFIATFGLTVLIENGVSAFIGSQSRSFALEMPAEVWTVAGVTLVPMQVVSLLTTVVLVSGLSWLVTKTAVGRAMRAVAENPVVAEANRISSQFIIVVTVLLAALIGSIAGILFAAESGGVAAFMGLDYGLKGMVVMIVGGVTSLTGATVAGLALGLLEAVTAGFVSSTYRDVITYGALFLVLLLRPQGLFKILSREARP